MLAATLPQPTRDRAWAELYTTATAVKGLGVGDLLEYQAHWQHNKPLIPGQFWLNYNFSDQGIVLQEVVEVRLPRARAVKLKSAAIKPSIAESGQYEMYTWTSSNLENEDDKKIKQEEQERAWQQVRGRQPQPELELSSFKDWEEVGTWYQGLQRDRVKPSAEIQAKAAELTKGLTDENAKIHAPDDRPTRVLRRGFVGCYQYTGCSFVLMLPDTVFSVQ